ncbi:MAG: acyltransferase [Bdellovibrio sp. CG10_big_fil_rev_8_21_14_0_10_47_8]|nr:MAG: acyltransferase [Bdellovibrio sp. CG10_big_fil_rev_8_21_14_0_10_47_8]
MIFFVFGLNGFFQFLPMPASIPEAATQFSGALFATGYFFPVLKATEVLCGALLLSGFFAPVALIILAPITIQIFLFHAFLTPGLQNLAMPLAIIILHVIAARGFWSLYAPLFQKRA